MSKYTIGLVFILNLLVIAQVPPHPRLLKLLENNSFRIDQSYALSNPVKVDLFFDKTSRALKKTMNSSETFITNTNLLILLVDFSDKAKTVSPTFFDNLIFSNNKGSLKSYFLEASYNQFFINTQNTCVDIGWITAPKPYSYYVNSQNGIGNYPNNTQKLVEDIIPLVDSKIDYSKYDNNKDGYLDALMIVHAGAAAEYTGNNNDIWSHAWATNNDIFLDGVHISRYSVQPEYLTQGVDVTIGVFAHELGHSLFGLPDLYDRDYTSWGLGDWSIMASGTWNGSPSGSTPALPDGWSRIRMGFNSPNEIFTNQLQLSIPPVNSINSIYKIRDKSKPQYEYFLIENRQKAGFDSYLPGSGLLIYHVDESVNTQNDKEYYPGMDINKHFLVALEQADGLFNIEKKNNQGDPGDPYPGSTNNSLFDMNSNPSSRLYTELITDFAVKNIKLDGSNILVDVILSNIKPMLVIINSGWDLISLPAKPEPFEVQKIFSNSATPVYFFDRYYSTTSELTSGKGYWTKGNNKVSIQLNVPVSNDFVINLKQGWNLIGASFQDVLVEKLIQNPLNNVISQFYSFENGYQPSDILRVGKGYWVKTITNGTLTAPRAVSKVNSNYQLLQELSSFPYIEIIDAKSNKALLYIANNRLISDDLPPVPPSGVFDIRWESNKLIESIDNGQSKIFHVNSASFPLTIKSSKKSYKIIDCIDGKFVNEILPVGKEITIGNSAIEKFIVKEFEIPTKLELFQNYPNPFNPETTIEYVIPKTNDGDNLTKVSLKVYDVLGEEVAVLVDEMKLAGMYRSTLNTQYTTLSSGIYFYQLTVDGNSITKKMILTK